MNKRDYKKRVSNFFSIDGKRSKSNSLTSSQQKLNTGDGNVSSSMRSESSSANTSLASTSISTPVQNVTQATPTSKVKETQAEEMATKKRDVIIVGAGLSGKCSCQTPDFFVFILLSLTFLWQAPNVKTHP